MATGDKQNETICHLPKLKKNIFLKKIFPENRDFSPFDAKLAKRPLIF